jgi:hypothetical protein
LNWKASADTARSRLAGAKRQEFLVAENHRNGCAPPRLPAGRPDRAVDAAAGGKRLGKNRQRRADVRRHGEAPLHRPEPVDQVARDVAEQEVGRRRPGPGTAAGKKAAVEDVRRGNHRPYMGRATRRRQSPAMARRPRRR